MDKYTGDITAYWSIVPGGEAKVRLEVKPGPLRISNMLMATANNPAASMLTVDGDVITIRGVDKEGADLVLRYRIVGEESIGPEDGWQLCEPIEN
jgi:hypothetical protein